MKCNDFLNYFEIKHNNNDTSAQVVCPAHDDNNASLTISVIDDKILMKCHAGCSNESILSKVQLSTKDLFNNEKEKKEKKKQLKFIKQYSYFDENNSPAHFVRRYTDEDNKKTFKQGTFLENGTLQYKLPKNLYLYNLPNVINAVKNDKTIFVVEGEKDADTLNELGFVATCNCGGAGKWRNTYNPFFKDANVVILPDNDDAGRKHANLVKNNIIHLAKSVKIVNLNGLDNKQDVTDYFTEHKFSVLDFQKCINQSEDLKKSEKFQNTVNRIKKEIDVGQIQDYIYNDRGKLTPSWVLDKLYEHEYIRTSVIGGKRKYYNYCDGAWKDIDKESLGIFFYDWLRDEDKTPQNINKVVSLISSDERFTVESHVWNSQKRKHNLKNGTFCWVTYKLLPHDPSDYFTTVTTFDYDLMATCPNYDQAIYDYSKTRGVADLNWIMRFEEILGYACYGERPFQVMAWFIGMAGRNGKGTAIRILEALVGLLLTASGVDSRDLRDKFYLSRFIGKRLATSGDIHTRIGNVPTVKGLTGGDKQTTDTKYGDNVTFENLAFFVWAMNHIPMLPDGESLKPVGKRIIPLLFNHEILNPDTEVETKILNELSGIFNKAVLGHQRLMHNRGFTPVENADNWKNNWIEKKPPLEEFFTRYTYDTNSKGLWLKDIFNDYCTMMNQTYGAKWEYENSIEVKGERKLKEKLIDNMFHRFKYYLKTDMIYSAKHGGTYTWVNNIKDTYVVPPAHTRLEMTDYSQMTDTIEQIYNKVTDQEREIEKLRNEFTQETII